MKNKVFKILMAFSMSLTCAFALPNTVFATDASTYSIVDGGGGGSPGYFVTGSSSFATKTKASSSFSVRANNPDKVTYVGTGGQITNGSFYTSSGPNVYSDGKTTNYKHQSRTTYCKYDFTPSNNVAGYSGIYIFTVY